MLTPSTDTERTQSDALFPAHVRRWLLAVVGSLMVAAIYLIAVRGSAILFDLRDAVSAFCF